MYRTKPKPVVKVLIPLTAPEPDQQLLRAVVEATGLDAAEATVEVEQRGELMSHEGAAQFVMTASIRDAFQQRMVVAVCFQFPENAQGSLLERRITANRTGIAHVWRVR